MFDDGLNKNGQTNKNVLKQFLKALYAITN